MNPLSRDRMPLLFSTALVVAGLASQQLAALAAIEVEPLPAASVSIPIESKHRGVGWQASPEVITADHLRPLQAVQVNWIAQTPFGWQRDLSTPRIRLATDGRVFWGETDVGLATTARLARAQGIETLLKPHIWVGGKFRGDIAMTSEKDWRAWFDSYREFILHYARFAEEHGIQVLCVGTELHRTVVEKPQEWRQLIAAIRQVYSGKLTYAGNWYREFEEVPFWDDLDYIGIQAYFPLQDTNGSTVEALRAGWKEPLDRIRRLSARFGKPVLITEIGYRSVGHAARKPWEWPEHGEAAPVDLETQRNCYQAFFDEVWPEPWLAGVYWWKWSPTTLETGAADNTGFSPQFKPAREVLKTHFDRAAHSPASP